MKLSGAALLAILAGLFFTSVAAIAEEDAGWRAPTEFASIKEWSFPPEDGPLKIRLFRSESDVDGGAYYRLQIISSRIPQTSVAEAGYLDVIVRDMEKHGIPIERLSSIDLELREPDVSRQLSLAAYRSDFWPKAMRSFQENQAVVRLLRGIDAFSAFNVAFKKYGLQTWVSGVEKIPVIRTSSLGLPKRGGVSFLPSGAAMCSIVLRKKT